MAFLKRLFKDRKEKSAEKAGQASDIELKDADVCPDASTHGAESAPSNEAGEFQETKSKKEDIRKEKDPILKERKTPAPKKTGKRKDYTAHKILLRPLITEKATELAQFNKYAFAVAKDATKTQVAETVRNIYGSVPVKVNIARFQGKKIRSGRRKGQTKSWKKAVVTLRPEDRIEIYEGV